MSSAYVLLSDWKQNANHTWLIARVCLGFLSALDRLPPGRPFHWGRTRVPSPHTHNNNNNNTARKSGELKKEPCAAKFHAISASELICEASGAERLSGGRMLFSSSPDYVFFSLTYI